MVQFNRGLVNFCAHHMHLIGSRREKEKEWHRRYSHQIGALYIYYHALLASNINWESICVHGILELGIGSVINLGRPFFAQKEKIDGGFSEPSDDRSILHAIPDRKSFKASQRRRYCR